MMGRYGVDQLSFAMLLLSCLLAMFTRGRLWPLSLVGLAVMALAYYRMLSRYISARAQENGVFLRPYPPVLPLPRLPPAAAGAPGPGEHRHHLPQVPPGIYQKDLIPARPGTRRRSRAFL